MTIKALFEYFLGAYTPIVVVQNGENVYMPDFAYIITALFFCMMFYLTLKFLFTMIGRLFD